MTTQVCSGCGWAFVLSSHFEWTSMFHIQYSLSLYVSFFQQTILQLWILQLSLFFFFLFFLFCGGWTIGHNRAASSIALVLVLKSLLFQTPDAEDAWDETWAVRTTAACVAHCNNHIKKYHWNILKLIITPFHHETGSRAPTIRLVSLDLLFFLTYNFNWDRDLEI